MSPRRHALYNWWVHYSPVGEVHEDSQVPGLGSRDEEAKYPFTGRRAGRDGQPRLRPDWSLWTPEFDSDGALQGPSCPPASSVPAVRADRLVVGTIPSEIERNNEEEMESKGSDSKSDRSSSPKSLRKNSLDPLREDNWRGREYAPKYSRGAEIAGFVSKGSEYDVLRGTDPFHPRRLFEFFRRSSVDVALRRAIKEYFARVEKFGALHDMEQSPGDDVLCSSCRKVDWRSLFFAGWEGDYSETIIFANTGGRHSELLFQEMVRNPDCPFCRLIVRVVKRKAPEAMQFDFSFVDVKVCISVDLNRLNRYGAYLLEVDLKRDEDDTNDQQYDLVHFDLILEKDSSLPHRQFRSGRKIKPELDLSTLKTWWTTCQQSHSNCRVNYNLYRPNDAQTPLEDRFVLRVIDVRQHRVVVARPRCRYLALSYVWGKAQVYRGSKLDYVNWEPFSGSERWPVSTDQYMDLPDDRLPKTIKDAMRVTLELGELYLWVDALCIVQDDPKELAASIGNMHQVYRDSVLTIVAAGGIDANSSLSGLEIGSRNVCNISETIRGLDIMLPGQSLADALGSSVWGTRAWTYQELIFSQKLLVFTDEQVYYKCSYDTLCEDRVESGPFLSGYPVEDDPHSRIPKEDQYDIRYNRRKPRLNELPWFHQYEQHIAEFTKRQLSFPADVLNACQAILSDFGRPNDFIFGLPLAKWENALIWGCAHGMKHPVLLHGSDGGGRADAPMIIALTRNLCFPSWSWAGWTGATAYEANPHHDLEPVVQWPWEQDDVKHSQKISLEISRTGILEFETFSISLDMPRQARTLQSYCMNDSSVLQGGEWELIEISSATSSGSPTGREIWALFIHWEDGIAYRDGWATIIDQHWYEAGVIRKKVRLG